jgi:hypothetical protein
MATSGHLLRGVSLVTGMKIHFSCCRTGRSHLAAARFVLAAAAAARGPPRPGHASHSGATERGDVEKPDHTSAARLVIPDRSARRRSSAEPGP